MRLSDNYIKKKTTPQLTIYFYLCKPLYSIQTYFLENLTLKFIEMHLTRSGWYQVLHFYNYIDINPFILHCEGS